MPGNERDPPGEGRKRHMNQKFRKLRVGKEIDEADGRIVDGSPRRAVGEIFLPAGKGSRLRLADKAYAYKIALYDCRFDERYLHTYSYAPEQAWVTYRGGLDAQDWRQEDFLFRDKGYFRILLRREDGKEFAEGESEDAERIFRWFPGEAERPAPSLFLPEIEATASRVRSLREEGSLVFALLADTHATVNGTWEDTVGNLWEVHERIGLDAVVHLGDFTDGIVPRDITYHYICGMLDDLRQIGVPVHAVLGNHDANYFQKNPDVFSLEEQARLFLSGSPGIRPREDCPYRFFDYGERGLRCIFLSSYRNEENLRYGYDAEQIAWLRDTLEGTRGDMRVLVFSHDAPMARLDFWADAIRGEAEIMGVLESWQERRRGLLGFVHGHTHADYIYGERNFPIVSVGCAKCEDMQEKKPEGSRTESRRLGTVTQELWDVLVLHPRKGRMDFVRFGAGRDRWVSVGEALP